MTVLVEPSLTEMVNSIRHTNRPCRLSWMVSHSRFTIGPRINMGTLNAMFFKSNSITPCSNEVITRNDHISNPQGTQELLTSL